MKFGEWLAYKLLNRPAWQLYWAIAAQSPLAVFPPGSVRYGVHWIGSESKARRQKCVLAVTGAGIAVYPIAAQMTADFTGAPEELRWFGRPHKYHPGTNHIILHTESGDSWRTLHLWLSQHRMRLFIQAIKRFATPEQITAYRRRRPYIHYGPLGVEPATQELTGEWLLDSPLNLYLTPAFLVLLNQTRILRAIPLTQIQNIQALRRLDAPRANGLVRFQVEGEKMAFATAHYTALGQALAEAAKCTLEEPLLQKRKSKDDEELDWD